MKALHRWLHLAEQARDAKILDEFFAFMFTPQEYEQLEKRYALIEALMQDKLPQREIAEKLNVSIAKITRGSNALKVLSPKLKNLLKKHFL